MQMPQVGSSIVVVIKNNHSLLPALFPDAPDTLVYAGTVLKSEGWDDPKTFRMTGEIKCPVRVIAMKNVVSFDGDSVEVQDANEDRIVTVQGSKGNEYVVTIKANGAATCTCSGFSFRKNCRHLLEANFQ